MKRSYYDLNIDSIIKPVIENIKTAYGFEKLNNLVFFNDFNLFQEEHSFLYDGLSIIEKYGAFPVDKSYDIKKYIDYALKGGMFEKDIFENIYLDIKTSLNCCQFIKTNCKNYISFMKRADSLVEMNYLKSLYERIFDDTFLVKDDASKPLFEIRKRIKKNEKNLKNVIVDELHKYKEILNDLTYYIRNGVYVLPVKTSFKNRIDGLVYDISDSGETTFIQPSSCLAISSELYKDATLEKEEIYNIYKALTNETLVYKNELIKNNIIFGELDLLNAKSIFAKNTDSNVINTTNDTHFNIKNARHPLIKKDLVISNDLIMNESINQLIISGPNAGGKSVFLKLIGSIVFLNQCIFPVPCSFDSSIGFFKNIYTDIGDAQSIEYNLSTFSSHISNISLFLKKLNKNDLVLIDELGTGTDPNDGEALAVAICQYLNNLGCKSIITSHFDGMKEYSFTDNRILCGSMIFDEKNLKPLYKLQIGIPGKSYGVLIAKKYGIDSSIIENASSYLKGLKNSNNLEYISRLNNEIFEVEKLKKQLKLQQESLNIKIKEVTKNNEVLQSKIDSFNQNLEKEREEIISDTLLTIKEIKKELLSGNNLKLHRLIEAENRLNNYSISSDDNKNENYHENFNVGEYVKDTFLNIEGTIISVKKDKLDIVSEGGKKYTLKISTNIIKTHRKIAKKQKNIDSFLKVDPLSYELNLIGMHVDEAIDALDKYIDKSILKNKEKIRIIHGYGTGVLRNAVHSYLKKNKNVKSFQLGGEYDGGLGTTIVYFKK